MINWKYDPNNVASDFAMAPEGVYRARIIETKEMKSASGYDMIMVNMALSGRTEKQALFITFMPDKPEITNRTLHDFWNCFQMPENDYNHLGWIGRAGVIDVKHEVSKKDGKLKATVKKMFSFEEQRDMNLPAFQDVGSSAPVESWQQQPAPQSFRSQMNQPPVASSGVPF